MDSTSTRSPNRAWHRLANPRLATGFLFVLFWISVANHWYVKAWSDPLNYLHYADNIAYEFSRSKWPVLYPAVLAALLPALGKYYIFLFNIVPVSLLLWAVGRLAVRCSREFLDESAAAWALPATVFLLIQFDPEMWVTLVNPYRDPLAMLLLVLGVSNYLAYFQKPNFPLRNLCWAGLCIGLAVSIREPNVLIVLPMMVLGAYRLFFRGPVPFWRTVGFFLAGLLAGMAILLIQNYLYSGNALVPPQSSAQNEVVPGMKGKLVGSILEKATRYVAAEGGWVWGIGLLAGVIESVRRRSSSLLLVVVPTALLFAGFYAYYKYFVPRYYFVVVLFLAVLASVGWVGLGTFVRLLPPRLRKAGWGLLFVLSVAASIPFLQERVATRSDRFRIAEARALARAVGPYVDENTVVLCERNLCEIINWFTPAQARTVHRYDRKGSLDPDFSKNIRALINRELNQGNRVYHIAPSEGKWHRHDTAHLIRHFDVEEKEAWSSEAFSLGEPWGGDDWVLYEVRPWSRKEAVMDVTVPSNPMPLMRIDAGLLDHTDSEPVQALLNDRLLPLAGGEGTYFGILDAVPSNRTVYLEMLAATMLPEHIRAELLSYDDPIRLDLGTCLFPQSRPFLAGDFCLPEFHHEKMIGTDDWGGVILPPLPKRDGHMWLVGAELGARYSKEPVEVDVSWGGVDRRRVAIPIDRQFHLFYLGGIRADEEGGENVIRFDVLKTMEDQEPRRRDPHAFVRRVLLYSVPLEEVRNINIGSGQDRIRYIGDGFYGGMRRPDKSTVRWTKGRARCWIYPNREEGIRVTVTLADGGRPEGAPDAEVWFEWNGKRISLGEPEGRSPEGIFKTFSFQVDAGQVLPGANALDVCSTVWRPSEWIESPDQRTLGVMVREVRWRPLEDSLPSN